MILGVGYSLWEENCDHIRTEISVGEKNKYLWVSEKHTAAGMSKTKVVSK